MPVRVAHALVGWLIPLALPFARGHFERAASNMQQILGPSVHAAETRRLTRDAFRNYARYMVDLVRIPSMNLADAARDIKVHGWEHVEAAQAMGRGVVLVSGHIGSWDLAASVFAVRGKTANVLVETLQPARWNERVQQIRSMLGLNAIPIETGVREMLAVLRRQEALVILVDRPVAKDGVPVTFFGRETRVPGGAATLALRCGSPVVPWAMVREPDGDGYAVHIGEPILTHEVGRGPVEIQDLTQRMMSWLEDVIRRYPDQWFMFRQMWPSDTAPAVRA